MFHIKQQGYKVSTSGDWKKSARSDNINFVVPKPEPFLTLMKLHWVLPTKKMWHACHIPVICVACHASCGGSSILDSVVVITSDTVGKHGVCAFLSHHHRLWVSPPSDLGRFEDVQNNAVSSNVAVLTSVGVVVVDCFDQVCRFRCWNHDCPFPLMQLSSRCGASSRALRAATAKRTELRISGCPWRRCPTLVKIVTHMCTVTF